MPHPPDFLARSKVVLALNRLLRLLLPSLAAGLIAGVIAVTVSMAFAALIFTGPLTPFVFPGVGIMLLGSLVVGLIVGLTSSLPGLVAGVQDSTVVVLALVAANISQTMLPDAPLENVFLTVSVTIALSTILTGVLFLLLGVFNLGNLIRYIPYPVIGGFLGGSGLLLVFGALALMVGAPVSALQLAPLVDPRLLGRWLPGLAFAIVLLIAVRRSEHPLTVPGVLAVGALVFFAALALMGVSVTEATAAGWLLSAPAATRGALWYPLPWTVLERVGWSALGREIGNLAVIGVISSVNLLLNATGIEIATRHDSDLNHELRITGLANLLSGAGGGMGGAHVLADSTLAYRMGGATHLVGVFLALVCGLVLTLGGRLLSFFPTPLLGGLLLFLGLDFLITWVYEVRFRLPGFDYGMILVILVVMNVVGVLEGVGLGLALAVVLFVVDYSRVGVVRHVLSGAEYQSFVERPHLYRQLLRQKCDWLYILELQGFVFFGTANTLLVTVRARLANTARAQPHFIVLDFRQVTGLDASAVLVFTRLVQLAQTHDLTLVVTHLNPRCQRQFRRDVFKGDSGDHWRIFPDLDHGLEWCEDRLIAIFHDVGLAARARTAKQQLEDFLPRSGRFMALLDFMAESESHQPEPPCQLVSDLSAYLERQDLAAGMILIQAGEPAQGMYFLETGTLSVEILDGEGRSRRVRKVQAGAIVGELGLYLGNDATASVVVEEPGTVYYLARNALLRMEREDPALAAIFHKFIAQRLSEQVMDTTRILQALLD